LARMPVAHPARHSCCRRVLRRPLPFPLFPYTTLFRSRRLIRAGKPIRDGERLSFLASPRSDVIGVLALIDPGGRADSADLVALEDRKSTRLNSSHVATSYAVFCLKTQT